MANYLVLTKVDADLAPSAEQSTAQGPSRAAHLHPSGVAEGHEPLTMDRRPSAVLTHVLAGRTRHRRCRTHGATLTRAAKRPRVAAAVGASTRLVAQAFFPAIQPRPAGPRYPAANLGSHPRPWPCWRMRGRVTYLPVPALVDRAAPSGVVPGELGGAAVLGAGSGFAEGAHHRSGADGAASAIASQHHHAWIVPPPKQGKRCSASPYPAGRARCGRVGSVDACRVLRSCGAGRYGWGWAGWAWPEGLGPTGADAWSAAGPPGQPRSAGRSRGAGVPRAARVARPSIRAREVAWP